MPEVASVGFSCGAKACGSEGDSHYSNCALCSNPAPECNRAACATRRRTGDILRKSHRSAPARHGPSGCRAFRSHIAPSRVVRPRIIETLSRGRKRSLIRSLPDPYSDHQINSRPSQRHGRFQVGSSQCQAKDSSGRWIDGDLSVVSHRIVERIVPSPSGRQQDLTV